MGHAADAELRALLARAFPGCAMERSRELRGGVSARAVDVSLRLAGGTAKRVVVRRPSWPTAEETRRAVAAEYAVLGRCAAFGIPAPRPCFLDENAPALVLEYIEGAPDFAPERLPDALRQMATELARIHRTGGPGELDFLPRRDDGIARQLASAPDALDATLGEAGLRTVLAKEWPWPRHNPDVLLHGDYWPGNLLWKSGRLVAVIDWEEAELGDPLTDVAVTRLDVAWAFGEAAMRAFTDCYRQQTRIDWRNLPRWDLCAALRPMSNLSRWAEAYAHPPISRPDIDERSMREVHRRFVEEALRSLESAGAPGPSGQGSDPI